MRRKSPGSAENAGLEQPISQEMEAQEGFRVFGLRVHRTYHGESQATQLLEVRIATSDIEAEAGTPKRGTCARKAGFATSRMGH